MAATAVFLDQGRWILPCSVCNSAEQATQDGADWIALGNVVTASWTCSDCSTVWTPTWPSDPAGVLTAVQDRHISNANWTPDQTIADLDTANADAPSGAAAGDPRFGLGIPH